MQVLGSHVKQEENFLVANYSYKHQQVKKSDGKFVVTPKEDKYTFKTNTKIPKLGVMLVGMGGNNGTTFTAGILANKHKINWFTKKGEQSPNYYGSITQASTTKIGTMGSEEVYLPLKDILPLVDPNEIVISGWDISTMNMGEAMKRAQVLDYNLIEKLYPEMSKIVPLPSIYYEDFIAANQSDRADNVLPGTRKMEHLEKIRKDIRKFKEDNKCDKVIVLWTANTERFSVYNQNIHGSTEALMRAIEKNDAEISPSTIFSIATILEGCSYINGSPQNSLLPGVVELAKKQDVFVVGDDFKSGQTQIQTALTDFLVGAGIQPQSIVSYNHLGNNDGQNLSSERQFRSKEISKKSCVDDILASNQVLYPDSIQIDHEIVIQYVPYTGDSKKAMDEYCSEIFLGGTQTHVLYNVCEDSLLAAPIILDLILLTELFERISYQTEEMPDFKRFNNVLSTLGYLCKAPLTDEDTPLVNSLSRQKASIDNLFKVCSGIMPDDNMLLEFRCPTIYK